jgi:peptide/nickel transport system substrate-binding protein
MRDYEIHLIEEAREGRMTREEVLRKAALLGLSIPAFAGVFAPASTAARTVGRTAGVTPRRGGTLRVGLLAPIAKPDPVVTSDDGAIYANQIAGEYLVHANPDFTLSPSLATAWKAETPKTWTFTLRQGVTWHDGSPFTAADVVATFDRLTDPQTNSAALSSLKGVLSHGNTERIDNQTVRFHLDTPFVFFPYLVSPFDYSSIVLPKNYTLGSYMDRPIGTGPFMLQQYVPQQSATWVKNPNYWNRNLPYLDQIKAQFYSDENAIAIGLAAGEIDLLVNQTIAGARPLFANRNVNTTLAKSAGYWAPAMRVDTPPFNDKRVRQAIALSLDRPKIIQTLFNGKAEIGNDHLFAPVYPDSSLALREVPQRKQNYALAKHLLAEAGHRHGLNVDFVTESDVFQLADYALLIKSQCKPAGINVNVRLLTDAAFHQNNLWLTTPWGMVSWLPRGSFGQTVNTAYRKSSPWNSSHFANSQFERLVRQYDGELDEQKRRKMAVNIARLQRDQVPTLIAFFQDSVRAARKSVHNLQPGPAVYSYLGNVWLS